VASASGRMVVGDCQGSECGIRLGGRPGRALRHARYSQTYSHTYGDSSSPYLVRAAAVRWLSKDV